jgi:DNA polymerase-3 subunit gamma/tau
MAYQVLARKYRPLLFSDVIGQDHVTRTLLNALAQDRIAHGYIFSGHRGIGKTTIARILASALNCRNVIGSELRPTPEPCLVCDSCLEIRQGNAVDVIEIDAATNRGIDEIRELRDAARYRPARDKFKIYILDEAHQITDAAFNALLKTLEEPPDHIVFMMATTQPEDIPQTIRSRCQHFSFHAVKLDDIVGQLRKISIDEKIIVDDATLSLLAEAGDGSMRDALSIMDQAIASAPTESVPGGPPNTPGPSNTPGGPSFASSAKGGVAQGQPHLKIAQVRELMGSVSNIVYENILASVHANNSADVIATVATLLDAGNGPQQLARQFVRYLRNCVVAKITKLDAATEATGIAADLLQISPEERSRAARSAALFTEEELSRFLSIMLRTFDELGYRQEQRFHLELGLLKLVHMQRLVPIEELLTQLGAKPPNTSTTTRTTNPSPTTPGGPSFAASPQRVGSGAAAISHPPPSPFESDRTRKTPAASTQSTTEPHPVTEGALALATDPELEGGLSPLSKTPTPAGFSPGPQLVTSTDLSSRQESAHVADAVEKPAGVARTAPDLTTLQSTLHAALASAKNQQSAADAIDDSTLTVANNTLTLQTTLSKQMLPVVLNAEAERLLKSVLAQQAPGLGLQVLPAMSVTPVAAPKKPRPVASGSATELAEKHPIVQEAKRIFSADLSNVIDLRDKNT